MIHGAFFIGTPANGDPVTAKDAKDDKCPKISWERNSSFGWYHSIWYNC